MSEYELTSLPARLGTRRVAVEPAGLPYDGVSERLLESGYRGIATRSTAVLPVSTLIALMFLVTVFSTMRFLMRPGSGRAAASAERARVRRSRLRAVLMTRGPAVAPVQSPAPPAASGAAFRK